MRFSFASVQSRDQIYLSHKILAYHIISYELRIFCSIYSSLRLLPKAPTLSLLREKEEENASLKPCEIRFPTCYKAVNVAKCSFQLWIKSHFFRKLPSNFQPHVVILMVHYSSLSTFYFILATGLLYIN